MTSNTHPLLLKYGVMDGASAATDHMFPAGQHVEVHSNGFRYKVPYPAALAYSKATGNPHHDTLAQMAAHPVRWRVPPRALPLVQKFGLDHLARMGWASRGDTVRVDPEQSNAHAFSLRTTGPGEKDVQLHFNGRDGSVHVNQVNASRHQKAKGWGGVAFLRSLTAARKNGFHEFHVTNAAGGPGKAHNGYYTWPRLGFNGLVPDQWRVGLPHGHDAHETFHDLFDAPGGADAWKGHGGDVTDGLHFDARPGSPHMARLMAYLKGVQARRKAPPQGPVKLARQDSHSWLTPAGKFLPIPAGHTHGSVAAKAGESIESLWGKGWQRVTYIGRELLAHNEAQAPTATQRQALIDHAVEEGFSHVKHDHGEDERILWSEHDQL
jgi:hypothetical protein